MDNKDAVYNVLAELEEGVSKAYQTVSEAQTESEILKDNLAAMYRKIKTLEADLKGATSKLDVDINEHGFWEGEEAESQHVYDSSLSNSLLEFFKHENAHNVCDFGCGMGCYVKHFSENGLNATGYDGNPKTPELTNGMCNVLDLAEPVRLDSPFSWAMSLEVGEHLPPQFEDVFIGNLHNNNKDGIVLSWAVEGQGGHGHYNERNNDYIKSKICELGYINDTQAEDQLRSSSTLSWFKNTIMVFRKAKQQ